MTIDLKKGISPNTVPAFVLFEGEMPGDHMFAKLLTKEDRKFLGGAIKKTDVKGEFSRLVFLPSGAKLLLLGLGEKRKYRERKVFIAMRRVVAVAKQEKLAEIHLRVEDFASGRLSSTQELLETFAIQAQLADFEFTKYKSDAEKRSRSLTVSFHAAGVSAKKSLVRGSVIGEEINGSRYLANTPGGDMTPDHLAKAAITLGKRAGFRVSVLGEKALKKLGMGGVLGVSRGSDTPPRFIVLEYLKGPKKEAPVVLVGKGITFDSGGLNLKPSSGIYEMHMDMTGGAAVLHAFAAIARLKIKKNLIGLIPAAENMVSGSSYRPGDVLTTMGGKTIEILNTDAEGRVVLADGLEYAKKYDPRLVIDVATLTGAAMVALGQRASALFVTDQKLERLFRETGERTGDYVWPLPLWEEFEGDIKGTFADVANDGKTRYGGAITGAVFLWQFIKGFNWAHIDIAPRMTSVDGEYLSKGAAGAPVNLLVHLLERY